jgi:hypothetical protein
MYLFRVHCTVTGDKNGNKIEPQYRAIKIRTAGTDTNTIFIKIRENDHFDTFDRYISSGLLLQLS